MATKRFQNLARVGWFGLELLLYSIFVVAYFLFVLHFLGGWVKQLFDEHRHLYAVVTLGLMAGQGAVLELLTSLLFQMIKNKVK